VAWALHYSPEKWARCACGGVLVLKRLSWILLSTAALLVLATGSIHCSGSTVPEGQDCVTREDCLNNNWTNNQCSRLDGHWECDMGVCFPVCDECATVAQCLGEWTLDCNGHFACTEGQCEQVCDSVGCGNDLCAPAGGETAESCPPDCAAPCETAGDCTATGVWDEPCEGRWECQSQDCVGVCDYESCGNGSCDTAQGENEDSCPGDCVDGCRSLVPSDCFSEQWAPTICQGRWNCLQGTCQKICDDINCGDGICWGLNGENEDSCFEDCLGGPCEELIDCLGQRWYKTGSGTQPSCQGHWQCNPANPPGQLTTGACEAVCDDASGGGCGDGTCDTLNGETPTSCLVDCGSGYSCTKSEDCNSLTRPSGCTGSWICASLICVPLCE